MDGDSYLQPCIILTALLLLAAFFASCETALASASKTRLKVLADRGDPRAKKALGISEHFEDAVTTLLICGNIVHLSTASYVTVLVTSRFGLSAVTLSTILTTIVIFFAGEMLPKSIAKKDSENLLLSFAGPLSFFIRLFAPCSRILSFIGTAASHIGSGEQELTVTEDELYDLVEDMAEEGRLTEEQEELISSVLQFDDVTVDSILTPRVDMAAIDVEDSPEEIFRFIKDQNHSRIPVYKDTVDNIIGVLQIRTYLKAYLAQHRYPELKEVLDPVFFAPQSMAIDELLEEMTQKKLNMAVITDSYGGTLGIVTVEDILEELVGEIWDEDDVVEEPVTEIPGGLIADASETVGDVLDYLEVEPDSEEDEERFTNLLMSDWIFEELGAIPKCGDSFSYGELTVSVLEMDHNRILKAKVLKAAGPSGTEKTPESAEGKDGDER